MIVGNDYVEILVAHKRAKPRNRQELAQMTSLLETIACNEIEQTPTLARLIDTLKALVSRYEEVESGLSGVSAGMLLDYAVLFHVSPNSFL